MLDANKVWYSVELTVLEADLLKEYLRKRNIYFEPSSAGPLVHFSCLMDQTECNKVNEFLLKYVRGVAQ